MDIIISFFMKDYIALLGLIVLIGSIILFIVVLINIARNPEPGDEAGEDAEDESSGEDSQAGAEPDILVTFLKSISEDLAEIKQKLNDLSAEAGKPSQGISKDTMESFNEQLQIKLKSIQIDELSKQTRDINAKLAAMYKVLSRIAEPEEKNEP